MLRLIKNIFRKKNNSNKIEVKFELEQGKYYQEIIPIETFVERISDLQKYFHQPKPLEQIEFIYCLVGNIVDNRIDSNGKTFKGTKHFSPGTKLYCYPPQWGDGYENIKVIGRHRGTARLVTMVIKSKYVTNWRLKKIYNRFIIKEMTNHYGWTDKESDRESIIGLITSINNSS